MDVQVPWDVLGLRSVLCRTSDHNVRPITPVQASEATQHDLLNAVAETARLATAVRWAASRDEAVLVKHLVDLGRRSAMERILRRTRRVDNVASAAASRSFAGSWPNANQSHLVRAEAHMVTGPNPTGQFQLTLQSELPTATAQIRSGSILRYRKCLPTV